MKIWLRFVGFVFCYLLVCWFQIGTAGEKDEKEIISRLNSELCSSHCEKKVIARLFIELLDNNPHFEARPVTGASSTNLWTLLQSTARGRAIAGTITPIYQAGSNHPVLTESQTILLRSAVSLSSDSEAKPDRDIFATAAILAGDLCMRQGTSHATEAECLFALPFFVAAQLQPCAGEAIPPSHAESTNRIRQSFGLDSQHLNIPFAFRSIVLAESDVSRQLTLDLKELLRVDRAKPGNAARLIFSIAVDSSILFLLDKNGDQNTDFALLEGCTPEEYYGLIRLARKVNQLNGAMREYERQSVLIKETAVPPNLDSLLIAVRDKMRPLIQVLARESKSLADTQFDIGTVPSELIPVLVRVLSYDGS
jgi:hypothetical protein